MRKEKTKKTKVSVTSSIVTGDLLSSKGESQRVDSIQLIDTLESNSSPNTDSPLSARGRLFSTSIPFSPQSGTSSRKTNFKIGRRPTVQEKDKPEFVRLYTQCGKYKIELRKVN